MSSAPTCTDAQHGHWRTQTKCWTRRGLGKGSWPDPALRTHTVTALQSPVEQRGNQAPWNSSRGAQWNQKWAKVSRNPRVIGGRTGVGEPPPVSLTSDCMQRRSYHYGNQGNCFSKILLLWVCPHSIHWHHQEEGCTIALWSCLRKTASKWKKQ